MSCRKRCFKMLQMFVWWGHQLGVFNGLKWTINFRLLSHSGLWLDWFLQGLNLLTVDSKSGSGSVIWDHSDHSTSNEWMNHFKCGFVSSLMCLDLSDLGLWISHPQFKKSLYCNFLFSGCLLCWYPGQPCWSHYWVPRFFNSWTVCIGNHSSWKITQHHSH